MEGRLAVVLLPVNGFAGAIFCVAKMAPFGFAHLAVSPGLGFIGGNLRFALVKRVGFFCIQLTGRHALVNALLLIAAKTRFATLLAEPVASTREEFGAFMKRERARYQKVVKASGARVD